MICSKIKLESELDTIWYMTAYSHEHLKEGQYCKRTAICAKNHPRMNHDLAIGQHLIANPDCTKTYTDVNFWIIGQARSSFHLSVLESVYITTHNLTLCKQINSFLAWALQVNNDE